mmetsp:Transcript_25378/g.30757  ORF Transcript_25378/g.30757 Transcript_25378/m.30757 type:complete len:204 (+) Transcript_25378:480-1091(+)
MDTEDVKRVVISIPMLEVCAAPAADRRSNHTKAEGPHWSNKSSCGSDGGQSSNATGQNANKARLPGLLNVQHHPHQRSCCCRDLGGNNGEGGFSPSSSCRASVESKPSDPEHPCSEHSQGQVALMQFVIPSFSANYGSNERSDTSSDVNHNSTSEINDTHVSEEATSPSPDHVASGVVHSHSPECSVDHHCVELHTLHHGPNH